MASPLMVPIAPLDLWSQPILRLPGMRSLCRSDCVLVTPIERDQLLSAGYAEDYREPEPSPEPEPAPPSIASMAIAAVVLGIEPESIAPEPAPEPDPIVEPEPIADGAEEPDQPAAAPEVELAGEPIAPRPNRRGRRGGGR